jgi:hypothetical protein
MMRRDFVSLIRNVAIFSFVASVVVVAAVPTSILLLDPPLPPHATKISSDGSDVVQLPPELGGARIERAERYGCVLLHPPEGPSIGPLCNRHLRCMPPSDDRRNTAILNVYQLPQPDAFLTQVASGCDSSCCDYRGTRFTGRGLRLDDTILDRLWSRVGYVGCALLFVGLICLGFGFRGRAGVLPRVLAAAFFFVGAAWIWSNL